MTIVTSMDSALLAQSDAKSDGFACLRRLLEELETSPANRDFGITHKRFEKRRDGVSEVVHCESPFEEQVVEFLENRGYEVRCQFGVQRPDGFGSFRIDIIVVDKGYPILAVECDGAAYHRSLSARTRDRARQSQLEKLGWRFHRVWSTNWWLFQEAEKQALLAAISSAQRESAPTRPAPAFGSTHSVNSRPENTSLVAPNDKAAPKPTVMPPIAKAPAPVQPALFDELGELFSKTKTSVPKEPIVPAPAPVRTKDQAFPMLLQDWSRRPGWPDAVLGRRVQWRGTWGTVTRTDRGGKSVFFREEHSGHELELSADFIRMRSGSGQ
jgi:very-short-patch-repair endonuclease